MTTVEILLAIVIIILIGGFTALFWPRKKKENNGENNLLLQAINMVKESIEQRDEKINKKLEDNIKDQQQTLQRQFGQSAQIIKDVTEKLTELDQTNKKVVGFAEQMQSLENILKNPKQRGILGEYFLESLLANVLQPNQYTMQYRFKNGQAVDAVVHMRDKVIPIDAKFSLENYNKLMQEPDAENRKKLETTFKTDIKNRIDETAKYIRPQENTTDFAFMFVPAEGVYYEMLIYKVGTTGVSAKDLVEYAFSKHVIIVSPTSFFAYLQTVLQGLKALQMEESVKDVIKRVGDLGRHIINYEDNFKKIGKHLGTTVNAYNISHKELAKIDKDVAKITDGTPSIELEMVDKPALEE